MMTARKTSALSTQVFIALKERLIHWEYSPAHRFTEEELCAEFGVSRSPVREALHMLVENGLVHKEPHRGYTVRQPDLKEIHDLYDVRQALERWEPRIDILKLDAAPASGSTRSPDDSNVLLITLEYQVRTTRSREVVQLTLDMQGAAV